MTVSDAFKQEIVESFRRFSPKSEASYVFTTTNPQFYTDFENFKLPLIAYLSDIVETSIYNAQDDVSEEFIKGYLDGTIQMIRILADLTLEAQENGAQG